jgi:hypothetical protein
MMMLVSLLLECCQGGQPVMSRGLNFSKVGLSEAVAELNADVSKM